MKVIVVFDIPVEYDKLRREVREYLKDFGGSFLQYSVYTLDCDEKVLERIVSGINRILTKGGGRVDIFIPCKKCFDKVRVVDTYEV